MSKSIERRVKDGIIAGLKTILGAAVVATSVRERMVAESDLSPGCPSILIRFPKTYKSGGCGFVKIIVPVVIEMRSVYSGDPDTVSKSDVRDGLDDFENAVDAIIRQDITWGALAFDTRFSNREFKFTSEDTAAPETALTLYYEVEIHHKADDPTVVC